MVHAFLIHTLRAPNAEDTGFCRVLYSCVFGSEKSPEDSRPYSTERDRLLRKEQLLAVARRSPCVGCSSRRPAGSPWTCLPSLQMNPCPCMRPHMGPSVCQQGTLSRSLGQWCGLV
ncbi:AP-5 complex subunit sigma-1 isoform 2-T2 [Rhynchocyon petersi]